MIRLRQRSACAWLFGALVAASTLSASTALAAPVSYMFESRIESERRRTDFFPGTFNDFFRDALFGPDGLPGADITMRGDGAIAYYFGEVGPGACTGRLAGGGRNPIFVDAGCVWGAIYHSWAAHGYEQGYGFPSGLEYQATFRGERGRRQIFVRFSERNLFDEGWAAFWNERTGEVIWLHPGEE